MVRTQTPTERRLPAYLGGSLVSELAYRIVLVASQRPPTVNTPGTLAIPSKQAVRDVVAMLVDRLDSDEADILRALAELERVGVLNPKEEADG